MSMVAELLVITTFVYFISNDYESKRHCPGKLPESSSHALKPETLRTLWEMHIATADPAPGGQLDPAVL